MKIRFHVLIFALIGGLTSPVLALAGSRGASNDVAIADAEAARKAETIRREEARREVQRLQREINALEQAVQANRHSETLLSPEEKARQDADAFQRASRALDKPASLGQAPVNLKDEKCTTCMEEFALGSCVARPSACHCRNFYCDECVRRWPQCTMCKSTGFNFANIETPLISTLSALKLLTEQLQAAEGVASGKFRRDIGGVRDLNTVSLPGGVLPTGGTVQPFWSTDTHFTRSQWRKLTGEDPDLKNCKGLSDFEKDTWDRYPNKPVTCVSWNDVQNALRKLNDRGVRARLISESEAQYLLRLDDREQITTTTYPWGNDEDQLTDYAWYSGNSDQSLHEVRTKRSLGNIYDARGNVLTLTHEGTSAIGGNYGVPAAHLRSDLIAPKMPVGGKDFRYPYLGFRLVILP